ncbi:MAG: hypothetical protein JXA38_05650 [Methanosarcinaceae archaeon]|nr:hypothetical protein [Methanosarcinaceae archaeon]
MNLTDAKTLTPEQLIEKVASCDDELYQHYARTNPVVKMAVDMARNMRGVKE